jgi:hypothetical protein
MQFAIMIGTSGISILENVGIGAFGCYAAFFAGDDRAGILDAVEDPVMNFSHDVGNYDRGTGVLKAAIAIGAAEGNKVPSGQEC